MAHEITVRDDGVAEAAYALQPAWHKLGTVLDHPMTSAEAIQVAHLDWTISKQSTYIRSNDGWHEVPQFKFVMRDDNHKVLGIVSDNYQLVQNVEAFAFLDTLVEEGQIQYEAAMSLKEGRVVILLARMPGIDYITSDDQLKRYILLSLTHDGTAAIKFGPTSVRVVCANTYALAQQEGALRDVAARTILDRGIRVTHVGDVKAKLQAAKAAIDQANILFDHYADIAKQLAQKKWTDEQFQRFLDVMCPELQPYDPDYTEKRAKAIQNTRAEIRTLYYNDEKQQLDGIERTAWAAVCAVTEHIDHLPRRGATWRQKAEARFNVCLYGPGRDMKHRAYEAAMRISC